MESSQSKRRKTSPSASVAVTAQNTELQSTPQDSYGTPRRRSSFMSPTSASLARFHSTFLLRANSVEPQRPISTRISNSDEQITGGDSGVNEFARVIAGGETIANLGSAVKAAPLTSFMRSDGQGGSVASTRSPRTMKADATLPKMDNTAMALSPRASPPEEARMEGAAVNGTDGEHQKMVVDGFGAETNAISARTLYSCHDNHLSSTPIRHKLHGSGMGIGEDGEPSLPSTPTHLGLEPALESPKGLLYSSPKARPKRSRKTDVKSSPLKQTDSAPEQPVLPQKHLLSSLGPPRFLPNTPRPPPTPEEAHVLRLKNRLADLENNLQDIEDLILREMLVSEWHRKESKDTVEQRKRRKNIVQLCSKVYSVTKEVGKTQAPQGAACSQDMSGGASLRILGETIPADNIYSPPPSTIKTSTLMQRLASFLPFSQRSPSPVFRPPSTQLRESYELLISNEPLDGEAPFTIVTSKPNLLSTSPENARLHFQNVCLSIPGHFLKADLRLTVDAPTQTVTEFHLEGVSSWAEPELAQWLRTPSETRGAAVLGRAFGRYWEAARLRALCWFNCTRDFENLIAKADAPQSSILSRQQIVFSHASVTLKITWRIVINDDGQVKNEASAHTVFPDVWQQGEWSALAKIGNAFDLLVLQKGVDEAVRTVCNLMFPH